MAKLSDSERARLPDRAFAYIDSRGKRRLPIHDEAHVRNAFARFNQVRFESDAARELAFTRLLKAAKKYGIVPVGFITGQLGTEDKKVGGRSLPTGFVTFLMTDIENSTAHLRWLGDRYQQLLAGVRDLIRTAVSEAGGQVVEVRADEAVAVFEQALPAIEAALRLQLGLGANTWPDDLEVRVRSGIHSGPITIADGGYVGLAVHTAARVCSVANGGQIVVSGDTVHVVEGLNPGDIGFRHLGSHHLAGLPQPVALYQVEAPGLLSEFPPLRTRTGG